MKIENEDYITWLSYYMATKEKILSLLFVETDARRRMPFIYARHMVIISGCICVMLDAQA
jgi:hypothetical protein